MFREVPRSHWAYKVSAQLEKADIASTSVCTAYGDPRNRTLVRYEFGVLTDRALRMMEAEDRAVVGKKHLHAHGKFTAQLRAAILRLAEEFRPELKSLRDLTRKRR